MSEMKLNDKIAVITGGNSGIGLATARLFKEQGASVIVVGRDLATLESTRKELGENSFAIQADVSKIADIDHVMDQVRGKFGRIDILFANAGISECPPIQETDEAFFEHMMGINVKGVFFTFTRALPLLSSGASAIFTSSVANKKGRPGDPLYSASKAAVRSLARTLAVDEEVLERGIRVNVVSPGAIQTPLTAQELPEMKEAINAYIKSSVPMKRWGQPEEVAKAVLFLASSDSSYLTGGEITVDGGLGEI
ncbi:SDR family oxidoreductase [Desulfosporosinus sp. PR]|uniref:SDR family oxidoreductase n=1 Tax=Candidatus Desulfosporosinus nitrosoreducens TaxID=3401928 RepID=UPI0027FC3D89|nr:SDR family oxidoreductase [Desulfosporosinus sp. PR]MDQ7096551.1 SDR family oxidoreductase [Desulfosporosinus sp. PR]